MAQAIHIPDIGDVDEVQVIELCVVPGDTVGPEDALIVIESDKASMEVPAGVTGIVEALVVAVGDDVAEGQLIARISTTDSASDVPESAPDSDQTKIAEADQAEAPAVDGDVGVDDAEDAGVSDAEDAGVDDAEDSETRALTEVAATQTPGATARIEVCVPDIGDSQDVVVIEVSVSAGDRVSADDLLVIVESDKASMEIPAGQAGSVLDVHVSEGADVTEGTLLVTLEVSADIGPGSQELNPVREDIVEQSIDPELTRAERQRQLPDPPVASPSSAPDSQQRESASIYAGPAVRRLARELGVDLSSVQGSGTRNRIVKDDVKAFVKLIIQDKSSGLVTGTAGSGIPPIPQIDFSKFGPVETSPLSRVRVVGATNLHRSWLNIPHVTQHDEVDVTELEVFRRSLKDEGELRGVKVTPLAFIIKACCYTLKAFSTFNASLDGDNKNFILKKYYHIGFAVDTEQGLMVPVIRDADQLGIWELSEEIATLGGKARDSKLAVADMQGGSFSISSLGAIGGTGFTPIINAPEVAILGVARLSTRPVWNGSEFMPRQMLPLSLSYDHRAVNGAEAGRFVVHLASLLADIRRLSL